MLAANALITEFINSLSMRLAGVTNEGREAQLADLVPNLLRGLAKLQGRPLIDLRGQAHEKAVGIPDFSIKDGALLIGHVETKPTGAGASTALFKGHDRDQWSRFSKLPNILYTDGVQWALYRSGAQEGPRLRLSFPKEGQTVAIADEAEVGKLAALVAQAFSWKAVSPSSLTGLAAALAPLCAVLRDEIRAQLHDEGSEVFTAADELRNALFPEQSHDQISDAIAQLCTYSMLLARSRGAAELSARGVEEALKLGHPVLARAVRILLDEDTEEEIGWALDTVRSLIEVVDFDALRGGTPLPGMTHHDQTWLYFYEAFLAAYDPKLRDEYGVYYTPSAVINAMTAVLSEVLRTRLGKTQGLAAPGVTVLDPAAGTGSFPLHMIEVAAATAHEALGPPAVSGVVRSLANNLFAFEVLVGPYSVAHLRISELLTDLGGALPEEGVQVFLTDTLASPHVEPMTLARMFEPLVEEQRRAIIVKDKTEILVCIGNPPYERRAATGEGGALHGGWVVHGDEQTEAAPIFETFLAPAREQTIFSHVASLYNEYVFFWRWALWKVFESPLEDGRSADDPGVVAFISASSFLSGPGFLGMRQHLRRLCDEIWVVDLGGEGRGSRREENVFAIQTPVTITIALRAKAPDMSVPATVRYARITGTREEKLEALGSVKSLDDLDWREVSSDWTAPLRPIGSDAWMQWPLLIDLFPWQHPGVKANRTWPIATLRSTLEARWDRLAAAKSQEVRASLFVNPRHGRGIDTVVDPETYPMPTSTKKVAELTSKDPRPVITRYAYRAFDRQWVIADPRVLALQRPPLWFAHSDQQTYMIGFLTGVLGTGPAVVASAEIPDLDSFRGSFGGKHVIPLYRDRDGTPNITAGILEAVSARLEREVAPEDFFAYAYAILSSPSYTERFYEELETPGPRLPITSEPDLFDEAVLLGRALLHLHTFGLRFTPASGPSATQPGGANLVKEVSGIPSEFTYDPASKALLIGTGIVAPVPQESWELHVSGWPVLSGWLRWRMRDPVGKAKSSKSPLDAMRPSSWPYEYTSELLELLWVLERTHDLRPLQDDLVERVCGSHVMLRETLPTPSAEQRKEPSVRAARRASGVHEDQTGLDL